MPPVVPDSHRSSADNRRRSRAPGIRPAAGLGNRRPADPVDRVQPGLRAAADRCPERMSRAGWRDGKSQTASPPRRAEWPESRIRSHLTHERVIPPVERLMSTSPAHRAAGDHLACLAAWRRRLSPAPAAGGDRARVHEVDAAAWRCIRRLGRLDEFLIPLRLIPHSSAAPAPAASRGDGHQSTRRSTGRVDDCHRRDPRRATSRCASGDVARRSARSSAACAATSGVFDAAVAVPGNAMFRTRVPSGRPCVRDRVYVGCSR